jgi:hypothetical protein
MIKLKNILIESISDVVWHKTSLEAGLNIISQNKFELSIAAGPDISDFAGKKQYFLSTARQRMGGYSELSNVRFELDGRKLSQRYKGGAVDYWKLGPRGSEYEDRLYSDAPAISNAKNYIKRVELWFMTDSGDFKKKTAVSIMEACLKQNIPCFLFYQKNKYLSGRGGELVTKELVKSLESKINSDSGDGAYVPKPLSPIDLKTIIYMAEIVGVPITEINNIFISNAKAKADFDTRKEDMGVDTYAQYIKNGWEEYENKKWALKEPYYYNTSDLRGTIEAEIHNAKRQVGSISREILLLIYKEARKNKVRPQDTVQFIINKGTENIIRR